MLSPSVSYFFMYHLQPSKRRVGVAERPQGLPSESPLWPFVLLCIFGRVAKQLLDAVEQCCIKRPIDGLCLLHQKV